MPRMIAPAPTGAIVEGAAPPRRGEVCHVNTQMRIAWMKPIESGCAPCPGESYVAAIEIHNGARARCRDSTIE
jgi:hypothetical protein